MAQSAVVRDYRVWRPWLWREDETRERLVAKGAARAAAYAGIDVAGAYHELLGSTGE